MTKKYSKQISLGYDPMTGKRIRKRVYADSKAGLRQAEHELIKEYAKRGNPSNMLYKDYEDLWWQANCSHLTPKTQSGYQDLLKKMEPLHNRKMSQIIRTDLQQILSDCWDRPVLCNKLASMMSNIWRNAAQDGVVEKNIAEKLKRPKRAAPVRRALTEAEMSAIKVADFTPEERLLVDILLQFGLRPGEALALDLRSFNRQDRTLTINKALTHDGTRPVIKSTKTGVTRTLPVPDSFWPKLPKKAMYLFQNEDGSLYSRGQVLNISNHIRLKINKAMGGSYYFRVTDMSLYTFRHNKASQLYYLPGVSLKKKAEYMGHSEMMFIRTYSHLIDAKEDTEALREAVI